MNIFSKIWIGGECKLHGEMTGKVPFLNKPCQACLNEDPNTTVEECAAKGHHFEHTVCQECIDGKHEDVTVKYEGSDWSIPISTIFPDPNHHWLTSRIQNPTTYGPNPERRTR